MGLAPGRRKPESVALCSAILEEQKAAINSAIERAAISERTEE
jgi:hypothetical protein